MSLQKSMTFHGLCEIKFLQAEMKWSSCGKNDKTGFEQSLSGLIIPGVVPFYPVLTEEEPIAGLNYPSS